MKSRLCCFVVPVFVFLGLAGGRAVAAGGEDLPPETRKLVAGMVEPWRKETGAPAVVVVVRQKGVTGFFPFGEAAPGRAASADSIFELASVTKVFTATSLAFEVRAKAMQLRDPLVQFLPELGAQEGDIRRVSLEQVVTHTSGLPRTPGGKTADGDWTREGVLQWAAQWKASGPPGMKALYSNVAVGLLGHAIAAQEKAPLIDVWRRQFLNVLGMEHTFFDVPAEALPDLVQGYGPAGKPVDPQSIGGWPAAGRLKASARDMGALLTAHMGERPDRPRVEAAMKLTQAPLFTASPRMTYGMCWQLLQMQGEALVDKNGGLAGTSTYIGFLPQKHVGVVVLVNRGKCHATTLGRRVLFGLIGKQVDAPGDDPEE